MSLCQNGISYAENLLLIKERDRKSNGKDKQRGSENRDDNNSGTEREISDDSDKMEVDAEDERSDSEKTTKVCDRLSFLETSVLSVVTLLSIATQVINKEKDATKDLRLCMKLGEGKHPKTSEKVKGWFCKFCL